ncbi:histidine kinase dimerization/phosphoacceptor domain -containing protein [Flavobacteriaceae bacterium S356]|uniref:histidine kinase n=1 Tax=Asprobacillus argus TaxID=3076534 RepID=A0ABU3LHP0_9FLAO|nr:histidine kinase dimerization/phosphoacceptor domain -containing protein [Flavobacteriaceae bacterium S356]
MLDTINDNYATLKNYFSSFDKAIEYNLKAIDWAKGNETVDEIILSKFNLLRIYFTTNAHDEAVVLSKELLAYPEIKDSILATRILFGLKEVYRKTEKFNEFLKILPIYYETSEKVGYPVSGGSVYESEVAYVHYRLNNYERAIESYKKSAKKYEERKLYLLQSSSLNNIGLCFRNMKRKDSAHHYFNKGIKVLEFLNSTPEGGHPYVNYFEDVLRTNAEETSSEADNANKLMFLYKKELKQAKGFNELNIVIDAYNGLGKLFLNQKKIGLSLKYIDSAETSLQSYVYPKAKSEMLELKVEALLLKGDHEKANSYFKLYNKYSDSLNKVKIDKSFMSGVLKYETDIKEKELEEAKTLFESQRRINLYQKIGLIGLFGMLVFLYFTFFKIRKDNRTIREQKITVDRALAENKILVKEVHHRVKNNLQVVASLLLIHAKKNKGFNSEEILAQSQHQIQSMSLIHEMLYQKDDIIDIQMQEYLEKLSSSLLTAYPNKKIKVTVLANEISLHLDYANPIGLIINELMTNSVKHGFKQMDTGEVFIKISRDKDLCELIYSDNGVGIKKDKLNLKKNKTFGSRLITSLAEEMNASVNIVNDTKLTYTFTFLDKNNAI